jgi:hypothetical protein
MNSMNCKEANMKPIPTEYKGTVFRSKAEAVFARSLHMANCGWMYEPKIHRPHDWDFEVIQPFDYFCECCGGVITGNRIILVEYKPSEPTRCYVDQLIEKVRQSVDAATRKAGRRFIDSYIVYGNPWNGPQPGNDCSYVCYPIFSNHSEHGWGDFIQSADNNRPYLFSSEHYIKDVLGISEQIVRKAMQFRFDLK